MYGCPRNVNAIMFIQRAHEINIQLMSHCEEKYDRFNGTLKYGRTACVLPVEKYSRSAVYIR